MVRQCLDGPGRSTLGWAVCIQDFVVPNVAVCTQPMGCQLVICHSDPCVPCECSQTSFIRTPWNPLKCVRIEKHADY